MSHFFSARERRPHLLPGAYSFFSATLSERVKREKQGEKVGTWEETSAVKGATPPSLLMLSTWREEATLET